jgi:hypothetical protein
MQGLGKINPATTWREKSDLNEAIEDERVTNAN